TLSSLDGTRHAACQRAHRSIKWNMMKLKTNIRSHSTCWLKLSANSTLATLAGSGRLHARQLAQVPTISGIRSHTCLGTPARR
ncbi:MAG: hypothetical protein ACKPKO_54685, partial [Candidatus Fonsibacter sp.]